MTKWLLLILILMAAAVSTVMVNPATTQTTLADVTMWIGNLNIEVGNLTAVVEGDNLTVTYNTINGWSMHETHLYIGSTAPTVSLLRAFPFKHEGLGGVKSDTYVISMSELGFTADDTVFIAAQAGVQKPGLPDLLKESAWANGDPIPSGKNSMFFSVVVPRPSVLDNLSRWFPFRIQKRAG